MVLGFGGGAGGSTRSTGGLSTGAGAALDIAGAAGAGAVTGAGDAAGTDSTRLSAADESPAC